MVTKQEATEATDTSNLTEKKALYHLFAPVCSKRKAFLYNTKKVEQ